MRLIFILLSFTLFGAYSQDSLATDSCTFYMPNTITADCCTYGCEYLEFYLDCELEEFEIIVLNKWGEFLYESNDRDELWNPFSEIKEEQVLIWQISGKVLRKGELVKVKWHGLISVL
ncbi:MAG: hypothetical protein GQ574_16095 [Crocinitomix sp.]|nr:hypothetical protein [Crocinitomix sp.]